MQHGGAAGYTRLSPPAQPLQQQQLEPSDPTDPSVKAARQRHTSPAATLRHRQPPGRRQVSVERSMTPPAGTGAAAASGDDGAGAASASAAAGSGGADSSGPSQPQQQLQVAATPTAGATSSGPYTRYYLKRLNTNVVHVLFYVVDEEGRGKLAVVGTDVKMSGHFVYASVQDFPQATPLRCTNRQQVMEWLAALGATEAAEENEVVLPDLAPQHWQQLNSADPMWTKPKLDREYTTYREEVGTLPDGRHFKNYYLVHEDQGHEKLMVTAEDSARKDRRYTYKAVEEVGGFAFENGKAVTDWLDYVLGRVTEPPDFMRRDAPPERKRKRKGEKGMGREGSGISGDMMLGQAGGMANLLHSYGLYDPPHAAHGGYGSSPAHHLSFSPYLQKRQYDPMTQGYAGMDSGSSSHAMAAAGAEVRAVFSTEPDLLQWVTAVPAQRDVTTLARWAERLRSCTISDEAPEAVLMGGGANWMHTSEAVKILQLLDNEVVSLRLLELSSISRPVAMLRCHPDPQIATLAARVTQRWRHIAQAALNRASSALGAYLPQGGGPGGPGGPGMGYMPGEVYAA